MKENIQIVFGLLGGLAVFIYGMNMMSECLRHPISFFEGRHKTNEENTK